MTDAEIREYLEDSGYPEHICKAGRTGLLERWASFVDQVEAGYKFGLEDYRNDLDLRGILDLIGAEGDDLELIDERFRVALTSTDTRVWESGPDDPWWDFGYPKKTKGELLADLRSEGLVEE